MIIVHHTHNFQKLKEIGIIKELTIMDLQAEPNYNTEEFTIKGMMQKKMKIKILFNMSQLWLSS